MLRRAALAGALILSVSCNRSEGGDSAAPLAGSAGSGKPASAGGSFSADLASELAGGSAKGSGAADKSADPGGAGSDTRPGSAAAPPSASEPKAGSGAGSDPKAGPMVAGGNPGAGATPTPGPGGGKAGDGKTGDGKGGDGKTGDGKGGDGKAVDGKAVDGKAVDGKGDGKTGADGKAAVTATGAKPASAEAGGKSSAGGASASTSGAGQPAEPSAGAPAHGPVKVSADLAAIKLSLLPNWDRDIDQPGTFQYVVRIKGTQSTRTFTFSYGYDDPKAPADRDQYKKYLQETRALTGEIRDRQRGAAWFLEGTDASGLPAFRYVVLYGGKRLICYGSLYKDAESNRLGDDRDQTVIQAKQICETLAL